MNFRNEHFKAGRAFSELGLSAVGCGRLSDLQRGFPDGGLAASRSVFATGPWPAHLCAPRQQLHRRPHAWAQGPKSSSRSDFVSVSASELTAGSSLLSGPWPRKWTCRSEFALGRSFQHLLLCFPGTAPADTGSPQACTQRHSQRGGHLILWSAGQRSQHGANPTDSFTAEKMWPLASVTPHPTNA